MSPSYAEAAAMAATYETIVAGPHDIDERIRHIQLDTPDRNNVLGQRMVLELYDAITRADRDPDVRAIMLGTTGELFCAGADLRELVEHDFESGVRFLTGYFETMDLLRDTGKPTVAGVEGICVAGGNELVNACDLIVAGESARFGQPEVLVGSTAAGGALQLLPLIVGDKRAREMLLTGELLTASEAERFGLINRVVPDDEVEAETVALVQDIIDRSSPQAYRVMKSVMKSWSNLAMMHQEMARDLTAQVWASEEFRERAADFLAKEDQTARPFLGVQPPER
jgi:enoyl-CoA hydratase